MSIKNSLSLQLEARVENFAAACEAKEVDLFNKNTEIAALKTKPKCASQENALAVNPKPSTLTPNPLTLNLEP